MRKIPYSVANLDSRTFKPQFSSSTQQYSKLNFNKISNDFIAKAEVTPKEEDIYIDEIIFYDGGDVEGYGYGN